LSIIAARSGRSGATRPKKSVEKLGYGARLDVPHNEHHAGDALLVGPALQPGGRMHEVLDGVDHNRLIRMLRKLHDALHAQQVRPVQRTHEIHEHFEGAGRNGLWRSQRKRADMGSWRLRS
jgi:hypothetical protein